MQQQWACIFFFLHKCFCSMEAEKFTNYNGKETVVCLFVCFKQCPCLEQCLQHLYWDVWGWGIPPTHNDDISCVTVMSKTDEMRADSLHWNCLGKHQIRVRFRTMYESDPSLMWGKGKSDFMSFELFRRLQIGWLLPVVWM